MKMCFRKICLYILYCSLPVLIYTPFSATLTVMDKWMHPFKYMKQIIFIREVSLYLCMYLSLIQTVTSLFMPNCSFSKGGGLFLFLIWTCVEKYFSSHQFLMWKQHELATGHHWNSKHPTEALFLVFVNLPAINIVHSILLYIRCYFCGVFLTCLALLWW